MLELDKETNKFEIHKSKFDQFKNQIFETDDIPEVSHVQKEVQTDPYEPPTLKRDNSKRKMSKTSNKNEKRSKSSSTSLVPKPNKEPTVNHHH